MKLPSRGFLHTTFHYDPDTGVLTWKARPLYHFSNFAQHRRFNAKYAGKQVRPGSEVVYIILPDGRRRNLSKDRIIWKLMTGLNPARPIVHIDNHPFNFRWRNLRLGYHKFSKLANEARTRWYGSAYREELLL